MTKLESLKESIQKERNLAYYDSCFGNRELQLQYQAQINAYDLVLGMIAGLDTSICLRCGGTVEANHGQSKCINCGAAHDIEGNLIPTINGKDVIRNKASASKG